MITFYVTWKFILIVFYFSIRIYDDDDVYPTPSVVWGLGACETLAPRNFNKVLKNSGKSMDISTLQRQATHHQQASTIDASH